jgi:DegV family protein with EDD domain
VTNSYAIIIDSVSDLPKELEEKYKVTIVPARVIIGSEDFLDRVGITREKFLHEIVHSKEKITTSQPSPKDFHDVFSKTLEETDHILYLGVSHKLSATFQNASIASRRFKGKITCIDTLSISLGITAIAHHAALRIEQGMELSPLIDEIKEMMKNTKIYILVEDLKYLLRGGRIGRARHAIGSLLNMKPLLHFVEGEIDALKSIRGVEAGYEAMIEEVTRDAQEFGNFVLSGAYGIENNKFERLSKSLQNKIQPLSYFYEPIGPAVICHVGPNVEAFFITKLPESSIEIYK